MDDILLGAELAGGQEDVRILEHGGLVLGVGHEVRSDVALVEAHALGEVKVQAEAVVVLDGHDAILADLVQSLGDLLANLGGRLRRSWRWRRSGPWSPRPWRRRPVP